MTRTLHVQIGTTPDHSDLDERLGAVDADEDVESQPSRLNVESLETFGRIFRPTNLTLLEAIAEHEPDSIRELAWIVERHPPEVTENVTELADYGLIELEENGRAKRPTMWYEGIEFSGDVPLHRRFLDLPKGPYTGQKDLRTGDTLQNTPISSSHVPWETLRIGIVSRRIPFRER